MTLLNIHIIISILTFILLIIDAMDAAYTFKRRYPDIKIPKRPLAVNIGTTFKNVLACSVPIVNIMFLFVLLFKSEEIKEQTITRKRLELLKEKNHDQVSEKDI